MLFKVSFLFTSACDDQPEQATYIVKADTEEDAKVKAFQAFHEVQPSGDVIHASTARVIMLPDKDCIRI